MLHHGDVYVCDFIEWRIHWDEVRMQQFFALLMRAIGTAMEQNKGISLPAPKVRAYGASKGQQRGYKISCWGLTADLLSRLDYIGGYFLYITRMDWRTELWMYDDDAAFDDYLLLRATDKIGTVGERKSPRRQKTNQRDNGGRGWFVGSMAAGVFTKAYRRADSGYALEFRVQKDVLKRRLDRFAHEYPHPRSQDIETLYHTIIQTGLDSYQRLCVQSDMFPQVVTGHDTPLPITTTPVFGPAPLIDRRSEEIADYYGEERRRLAAQPNGDESVQERG